MPQEPWRSAGMVTVGDSFLGLSQAGSRWHFHSAHALHPAHPLQSKHQRCWCKTAERVCAVPHVTGRSSFLLLLSVAEWLGEIRATISLPGSPATANEAATCHHPQALVTAGGTPSHPMSLWGDHVCWSLSTTVNYGSTWHRHSSSSKWKP